MSLWQREANRGPEREGGHVVSLRLGVGFMIRPVVLFTLPLWETNSKVEHSIGTLPLVCALAKCVYPAQAFICGEARHLSPPYQWLLLLFWPGVRR